MHSKQSFSVPRTGSSAGAGGNQYLRKRFDLRSPSFPPCLAPGERAVHDVLCAKRGIHDRGRQRGTKRPLFTGDQLYGMGLPKLLGTVQHAYSLFGVGSEKALSRRGFRVDEGSMDCGAGLFGVERVVAESSARRWKCGNRA